MLLTCSKVRVGHVTFLLTIVTGTVVVDVAIGVVDSTCYLVAFNINTYQFVAPAQTPGAALSAHLFTATPLL